MAAVFADHPDVPSSSTKGMMGHTLGAAGAVEAVVSALALQHGLLPASVGLQTPDPAIPSTSLSAPALAQPAPRAIEFIRLWRQRQLGAVAAEVA